MQRFNQSIITKKSTHTCCSSSFHHYEYNTKGQDNFVDHLWLMFAFDNNKLT
jgi:hypothetical protein